jgi:hypothetical protein
MKKRILKSLVLVLFVALGIVFSGVNIVGGEHLTAGQYQEWILKTYDFRPRLSLDRRHQRRRLSGYVFGQPVILQKVDGTRVLEVTDQQISDDMPFPIRGQ